MVVLVLVRANGHELCPHNEGELCQAEPEGPSVVCAVETWGSRCPPLPPLNKGGGCVAGKVGECLEGGRWWCGAECVGKGGRRGM